MTNKNERIDGLHISRRALLVKGAAVTAAPILIASPVGKAGAIIFESTRASQSLSNVPFGFHSHLKNGHLSHSFQGGRAYNAQLKRFMQLDAMNYSPFGAGGIHGYAFSNNDPVNMRDPSGNFAVMSVILGSILGMVVGAAVSATAEGVRTAITGGKFDWTQIAIGATVGLISGGIGAASGGASLSVKALASVADSIISGGAEFGLSVASGYDAKEAAISAGIGAAIGLITFGVGVGISGAKPTVRPASRSVSRTSSADYIPLNTMAPENPRAGAAPTNALSRTNSMSSVSSLELSSSPIMQETSFPLEDMLNVHLLRDHLTPYLNDQSLGHLSSLNRNLNYNFEATMKQRMKFRYNANKLELSSLQRRYRESLGGGRASLDELSSLIRNKYLMATKQRQLIAAWIRQFPSDTTVSYTDGVFNIIG
ncbi:RHS repeat-associated core domain-containing protein [Vibrio harveyi]|uniref:RHS repeat-associated core domain-containing protein n=1 Tax=Vibrio harveyi TaxID=669 RepID=UPI00067FDD2D|nr:RHS repeat-associated core domain-containing protein [Vibrio harveyi]